MMNSKVLFLVFAFSLLFSTLVLFSVQNLTGEALVPSIASVSFREVGSTIWLDIEISHQSPPTIGPSHYVSNVQLEINGAATDLTQTPQSTTTFIVEYNLGSNANTYSVRARALCNVHGNSAWSATTTYMSPSPTPTPTSTPTPTPTTTPSPPPEEIPYILYIGIVIGAVIAVAAIVAVLKFRK